MNREEEFRFVGDIYTEMISKQHFIDWLRQSGNSENIILAVLLEQDIIEMPRCECIGKVDGGK